MRHESLPLFPSLPQWSSTQTVSLQKSYFKVLLLYSHHPSSPNLSSHQYPQRLQGHRGEMTTPPWVPAESPVWSKKTKATYNGLKSTTNRQAPLTVLHITAKERDEMTPDMTAAIETVQLDNAQDWGSTEDRARVLQAVEVLRNHPKWRSMLSWAKTQGEEEENVKAAVKSLLHIHHTNATKRVKRKQQPTIKQEDAAQVVPRVRGTDLQKTPEARLPIKTDANGPTAYGLRAEEGEIETIVTFGELQPGRHFEGLLEKARTEWNRKEKPVSLLIDLASGKQMRVVSQQGMDFVLGGWKSYPDQNSAIAVVAIWGKGSIRDAKIVGKKVTTKEIAVRGRFYN